MNKEKLMNILIGTGRFTLNQIKKFKPTKKNFIKLGLVIVILAGSCYWITHRFGGEMSKVSDVEESGKYYLISCENGDKINLSKNGELKLKRIYKKVDSKKFQEVSYSVFKSDLKSYELSVRDNLNHDLQYAVTNSINSDNVVKTSAVVISVNGNKITVNPIDKDPKQSNFFVDFKNGEFSDEIKPGLIKVNLSRNETIVIEVPEDQVSLIPSLIPTLQQKIEDCYSVKSIDRVK